MFVSFNRNTTGVTSGAGTSYLKYMSSPRFLWGSCWSFCRFLCSVSPSIFWIFLSFDHCIVFLRVTVSDYPFGIVKHFFQQLRRRRKSIQPTKYNNIYICTRGFHPPSSQWHWLAWFIIDVYCRYLQLLNHVIIIKTKVPRA